MGVYFVQSGYDGGVKIGMTENVVKRVGQLQSANPILLLLRAWQPDWVAMQEQILHRRLAAFRIHTEWFAPTDEVYQAMSDCYAGAWHNEPTDIDFAMDPPVAVGLRAARMHCGLSQARLSKLTGISAMTLSLIERDRQGCNPNYYRILRDALGVDFVHRPMGLRVPRAA